MLRVMVLFLRFDKIDWYNLREIRGGGVYIWVGVILVLSLAGLPPLLGFFPKLIVFQSLMGVRVMIIVVILMFIGLNLYFYSNVRFLIFRGKRVKVVRGRINLVSAGFISVVAIGRFFCY